MDTLEDSLKICFRIKVSSSRKKIDPDSTALTNGSSMTPRTGNEHLTNR